jgi:hypothetical protein
MCNVDGYPSRAHGDDNSRVGGRHELPPAVDFDNIGGSEMGGRLRTVRNPGSESGLENVPRKGKGNQFVRYNQRKQADVMKTRLGAERGKETRVNGA